MKGTATADTDGHGTATTDTWGATTDGPSYPESFATWNVREISHAETRRARPYPPETIALARCFGVRL